MSLRNPVLCVKTKCASFKPSSLLLLLFFPQPPSGHFDWIFSKYDIFIDHYKFPDCTNDSLVVSYVWKVLIMNTTSSNTASDDYNDPDSYSEFDSFSFSGGETSSDAYSEDSRSSDDNIPDSLDDSTSSSTDDTTNDNDYPLSGFISSNHALSLQTNQLPPQHNSIALITVKYHTYIHGV